MYNRYIRNDRGEYTCIPEEERPLPPLGGERTQGRMEGNGTGLPKDRRPGQDSAPPPRPGAQEDSRPPRPGPPSHPGAFPGPGPYPEQGPPPPPGRSPLSEAPPPPGPLPGSEAFPPPKPPPGSEASSPPGAPPWPQETPRQDGLSSALRRLLDEARLSQVDTGDLLLLGILFLLFHEEADQELLMALGLLLIL